jgi:molecular chaperone DnaJ
MPAARRDYYEVLGVEPDADQATIRTAFRARARTLHPDVSAEPDGGERFRELAEAYSVLSRSTSRLLYDRLGYRGRGHGGLAPFARHARRRAEAEAREAAGFVAEVRVGYYDAARGTATTARLSGTASCPACGGRGEGPGEAEPCASCEGTGRLRRTSTADFGRLLQIERCHRCGGRGSVSRPCGACAGTGRRELRGEALVTIPAGTRDGRRIALADGGEVVVRVLPAPREGRAVQLGAAVGLALAVALLVVVLFFS